MPRTARVLGAALLPLLAAFGLAVPATAVTEPLIDKELRSLPAFNRALNAGRVNPALGAIDQSTVDQVDARGMEINVGTVNAGADILRRR
jgi:hypothetical protein